MDTKILVNKLKDLFHKERKNGLLVDAIGLAPAYGSMVSDSYVLGVSAPSMPEVSRYDKMDTIIDLLFAHLTEDERRMIDRVRVYGSIEELRNYAESDFDDSIYQDERPMHLSAMLYEVA